MLVLQQPASLPQHYGYWRCLTQLLSRTELIVGFRNTRTRTLELPACQVEPGLPHPQGLYDSTFNDAILGPKVLIKGTSLLSSVVVEAGARIVGES